MFVEAYVNYRKKCVTSLKTEDAEQQQGKIKLSILWLLISIFSLVPMCIPSLVTHIIFNILIIGALTATSLAYQKHICYIRARESGKLISLQIARRVPMLLMNFMAWVSDQCLRYCAEQITATNRKINEIATSCGYNDLPNLTRAFKKRFCTSPSEYRKGNGS